MLKLVNPNYCATVVKVEKLVQLENCNNVQAAIIMGNQIIVSKEVKIGDIGLFFPVEVQLSKKYLSESTKSNVSKETFEHSKYLYNGIDRIDSSKGYTNDNCVTCCEMCNKAKRDVSYETFIMYLKQISKYYANKD